MATEASSLHSSQGNASSSRRRWLTPPDGYRWRRQTTGTFLAFHALLPLIFVPWLFSWAGVVAAIVGFHLFNTVGIDMCYHRLLSHRSFKVPLWLERVLAILGICSMQDSPCQWAATHRRHHRFSDHDNDPHSPVHGMFWGHLGWLLVKENEPNRATLHRQYVADMLRDPFYFGVERMTLSLWIFVAHMILFYIGGFIAGFAGTGTIMGGVQLGMSLFVWGVIARVVYSWHATWAVNSIAHSWGYRNYNTNDNSRNNWILSIFNSGGGWHNNHHGDQRSAAHGHHRWWEIDTAYLVIRALEIVGLAWDVTPRRKLHLLNRRRSTLVPPADTPATIPIQDARRPAGDEDGENRRAA